MAHSFNQQKRTLPILEAGALKARCQQGHAPSGGSRGRPFLPLPAAGGSQHFLTDGHITPISASTFTRPPPLLCLKSPSAFLLLGCLTLDLGFTRIIPAPLLNYICKKHFFQKGHIYRFRGHGHFFWGVTHSTQFTTPYEKNSRSVTVGSGSSGFESHLCHLITKIQSFLSMLPTPTLIPVKSPSRQ